MTLKHVVAAIQMNCELGNKEGNLQKAQTFIAQALEQQATLIVLPELFNIGYRVEEQDWQYAETIPGETTEFFTAYGNSTRCHDYWLYFRTR